MKVLLFVGIFLGAVSLTGAQTTATEIHSSSILTRMQTACPMIWPTRYRRGVLNYEVKSDKIDEARRCVQKALARIVADPWPINKSGFCEATHIAKRNGKIILYNPNCK